MAVVLPADTLTAPLLPRTIRHTTHQTTNMANTWPTQTKIIFAICIAVAIVLVAALAILLQCRRRKRRRLAHHNNRNTMETLAANQGWGSSSSTVGGYNPGLVRQLTDQMRQQEKQAEGGQGKGKEKERFSERSGTVAGMYDAQDAMHHCHHTASHDGRGGAAGEGAFENVPLDGPGAHGAGAAPLRRPGDIYRYGDRQSRFSP